MAKINNFEDIFAWQHAQALTLAIYKELRSCKDFSYRDQIQRASVSIMNNIAEGFDRRSDKELKQFLYIAKGSCAEVRSMLTIASELGYIQKSQVDKLIADTVSISKMLAVFIKKIG